MNTSELQEVTHEGIEEFLNRGDAFSRQDESDDGRFYALDRFVDHLDNRTTGKIKRPHKCFGFSSGGAVADSYYLDLVLIAERFDFYSGIIALSLAGVGEDRGMVQELALAIKAD